MKTVKRNFLTSIHFKRNINLKTKILIKFNYLIELDECSNFCENLTRCKVQVNAYQTSV